MTLASTPRLDPDLVSFQGDFWFRPNSFTAGISMDAKSRVAKVGLWPIATLQCSSTIFFYQVCYHIQSLFF
jgi:hypothetical protein